MKFLNFFVICNFFVGGAWAHESYANQGKKNPQDAVMAFAQELCTSDVASQSNVLAHFCNLYGAGIETEVITEQGSIQLKRRSKKVCFTLDNFNFANKALENPGIRINIQSNDSVSDKPFTEMFEEYVELLQSYVKVHGNEYGFSNGFLGICTGKVRGDHGITHLSFYGLGLKTFPISITMYDSLKHLKKLQITGNPEMKRHNSSDYDYLEVLGSFDKLEWLDLSYNAFSGEIYDTFNPLTNIAFIDLAGNRFTGWIKQADEQNDVLRAFKKFKNLELLSLWRNCFDTSNLDPEDTFQIVDNKKRARVFFGSSSSAQQAGPHCEEGSGLGIPPKQ